MKKTIKFLSMAALALVGAMTAGCSSDDNIISQPQQPENKNNVVTLTTTVGFDEATGGITRALAIDYDAKTLTKTFAAGDQIAVVYENTGGTKVKAVTEALTAENITADGKSATFTVTLTDPKASGTVKYIYPAAMAGETDVDYTNLNAQDGTLATIASNLDLAVYEGNLTSDVKLPASASLENKLAIIAYTIKDSDGSSDLTSTITGMTLSDGTNNYEVTRSAAAGPIYVAIQPTSEADIEYTATNGTKNYAKSVTGKTYAAGEFYQLGQRMTAAPVADLLDVKFNADGSAVDLSTKSKTVTHCGSTSSVYYSETYQRYVASFSHTWGATATGYYKVDFESDQAFRNALANGHSLEVLCMANYDGEIPDVEAKPFSAMQGGGTGFLVTKKSDDRQNELCFLPNTSTDGTSTWRWTNCGIVPQKGVFYHIVGVWDKTNSKSYIYVNGELKKEQDAPGNLNFAQTGCNWFCIGGDPNDANTANGAWQGDVAIARVYDKPLTADEAKALWLIDGK